MGRDELTHLGVRDEELAQWVVVSVVRLSECEYDQTNHLDMFAPVLAFACQVSMKICLG